VSDWGADLALAHALADAADSITLPRFRAADLRVETKPDLTPVTDADRDTERALRQMLTRERPGDAVIGEEYGEDRAGAERRWVLDPIDGTKNFVRGVPVWASLIALEAEGRPVVGMVSAPALGRRWWAGRGDGAWTGTSSSDARRCRVSAVSAVEDAFLSYSSLDGWSGRLERLAGRVWRTRAFGDFWSHLLVAEGGVDISCEPEVSLWDLAALQPIVEEAGGRFSDLSGVDRADGGSVLCTNGLLHDAVLALLSGTPS
jgi:histidinol-phosphatase